MSKAIWQGETKRIWPRAVRCFDSMKYINNTLLVLSTLNIQAIFAIVAITVVIVMATTTILSTAPKAAAHRVGPTPRADVEKYQIADQNTGVVAKCVRVTTSNGATHGQCHSVH